MLAYGEFEVVLFGDDAILVGAQMNNVAWKHRSLILIGTSPACLPLRTSPSRKLSWFSDGFPLEKAQAYIALRRVPTMNDLDKQVGD